MRPLLLLLPLLLAACSREPTPVNFASDLPDAVTRPILRDYLDLASASVVRTQAGPAEVLWDRDPERVLQLATQGALAPLPPAATAERPPALVGAERRWAAADAVVRVLVHDPEQIPDAQAPTRVLALAEARHARRLVLAEPGRGAAAWHAAALASRLGDAAAVAFFAGLRGAGADVVADDAAVVAALVAGRRPLALLDSDAAYAAQAQVRRLVITVPDQEEDGSGAFVLPSVVALTGRGAASDVARGAAEYLLAPPQAFRIALARNALVVVADGAAPPGVLNVAALRAMPADYAALAARLPAVRAALAPGA